MELISRPKVNGRHHCVDQNSGFEATEMKILDPFKDMGKEVRDCFLLGAERELSLIAAICIALFYWPFEVQREAVVCAV